MNQARAIYQFLKWLLLIALAGLLVYWLVRNWECLLQLAKSLWSDFIALLRGLFPAKAAPEKSRASAGQDRSKPRLRPFSAYRDPFATGRDRHWSCERLIVYTYEALQAWSREWGTQRRPQHTPWEYGQQLSRNYPEAAPWAQDLIFYYNHVAFSNLIPDAYSPEPLRRLWSFMTGNRAG